MQIIPTVTENEWKKAEERLGVIREMSRWVQIDVIDGIFAEGKSFELELLNSYEFTENILWDVHLMVKEPINWIEKCIFVGASRITGQVEMMGDRKKFVKKVKSEGIDAGLAFDIKTKIDQTPEDIDLVLLMGRKAGFGVYDFNEKVFEKIKTVKNQGFQIAVDGGVDLKNTDKLEKAGVDIIYSGNNFIKIYANRNRN